MRLLIVEDEVDLAEPLAMGLRRHGYAVDIAPDGEQAYDLLTVETYDLMILDVGLPRMSGLQLARRIRQEQPQLFILILTARGQPTDRVEGLDQGADDYMSKPFLFEELVARIRALLRRDVRTRDPVLRCRDIQLDPASRQAWLGDQELILTRKELALLEHLMRRQGEVVSQEELLDHVWDAVVNPFTNVVPVHVNALRRALHDDAKNPSYIKTIIGEGYQLLCAPHEAQQL